MPVGSAEVLEDRSLLSASVPSIDGAGNNLLHPDWGSAGSGLLRLAAAEYADGVAAPAGDDRPSPREISNALADQGGLDIISDRGLSAMIYAWGQFLDHDLDLTPTGGSEEMSIAVPQWDPQFDPDGTGTQTIDTTRSIYNEATGTGAGKPRQQINTVTAWLDGSMIYGSDAETAASLRTFQKGLLKTTAGNLLPYDDQGFYLAGDVRANENPELTSLQTLFVREHNYWATKLAKQNPRWSDEQLYQQARRIVIGELQAITYNEWLPALLGPGALDRYRGYNPNVNPGIANEFSAAGFRLGHSLLGDDIEFLDNNGREVAEEISLHDAFFNPAVVAENNIDPILKYLATDPSSELDPMIVDSVRNFLFVGPGQGGFDLASLNIQRGRDHGLADYNTVRAAYGLPRVTSFSQITSDPQLAARLEQLYGSVDNIDLWVGALSEDHVRGGSVGVTLRAIISDQFERLRDGDRFWYQRNFSGSLLKQVSGTTLADVLKRNTSLTNLQGNVFFFKASIGGTAFLDQNHDGRRSLREKALSNQLVELLDAESGEVIASTRTNSLGAFKFDVADGVRPGSYQLRVAGHDLSISRTVSITRGDQFLNVSLGVWPGASDTQPAPTPKISTSPTPLADTRSLDSVFGAERFADLLG
jgi:hypothetical protein